MKEISELILPDDVRYSEDHEWARMKDGTVMIGISDYAQDQMGDIVFVELPEVGDVFAQWEEFGTIESVKTVAELYMPVGGKVIAVNTDIEESPELVNISPYEDGWMIEVEPTDPGEMESLMDVDAYLDMLKGYEE